MVIVTGTLQKQAWPDKVLPPVEQASPGFWSASGAWSRPWDEIGPFMQCQSNGETMAHCLLLELHGRVQRVGSTPSQFFLVDQ